MLFGISSLDIKVNVAMSMIVFGIIIGCMVQCNHLKSNTEIIKNYYTIIIFLTFTYVLYVVSFYGQGAANTTAVNIMITLTAVHFIIIIT